MNVILTAPTVTAVGTAIAGALTGPLADWTVLDGIDPAQAYLPKSLTIGGTWDPEVEQFTSQGTVTVETVERGAGRSLTEVTSIACLAYAGGGDEGFDVHRADLNAMLTAVRQGLRALAFIDGHNVMVSLSSQDWAQVLDASGSGAMVMFTVTVQALV